MKKIKIVGQPMYNIGDLAACKALVNLFKADGNYEVELAFPQNCMVDPEFLKLKDITIIKNIPKISKVEKILTILCPNFLKIKLFITNKQKYKHITNADFILFSPGGLELGLYKSWNYLWLMATLIALNKKFGIYSRSMGDFRDKTLTDFIFKRQAIKFLKKSIFNGLRDLKSQQNAQQVKVPFYPAIDVVFSNIPDYVISAKISKMIGDNYIVFTPSKFEWHYKLKKYPTERFSKLYILILNTIIKNTDKSIIMLPHLYRENIDSLYFNDLKKKSINPSRIIILEDIPNPDLYQKVIKGADFTIAARLHQIIFSINNRTPFLCLSYEHKMEDMLRILNLDKYSIRIEDLLGDRFNIKELLIDILSGKKEQLQEITAAQKKAQKVARNSFHVLLKRLNSIH
ncbi:MAG: polysaccharide pyruvyl transferase family protein [Candidatus Atribacteria bacterium]|nr:polysaccharide pyruvyl transferase family protein [Candidatus Atribacteria bacterium]